MKKPLKAYTRPLVKSALDMSKTEDGSVLDGDPDKVAAERGQSVRRPGPNEAYIDLDHGDRTYFDMAIDTLRVNDVPIQCVAFYPSRSPGHYHAIVQVGHPLSAMERILLQAVLGSDIKRELWSYLRLLKGHPDPTVLFEAPAGWTPTWEIKE